MTHDRRFPRLLAALLACGVLALSACSSSSGNSKDFSFTAKNNIGTLIAQSQRKPAQDIGGTLISGGSFSLASTRGSVTLLNFWASWCGPCKVETPQLDSLYRQVKSQGVRFVGFDTKDEKDSAQNFISQNQISFPVVFDQQAAVQLELGNIPGVLPFTVLVDKQGRVAAVYIDKLSPKDLQGPLTTLLAER